MLPISIKKFAHHPLTSIIKYPATIDYVGVEHNGRSIQWAIAGGMLTGSKWNGAVEFYDAATSALFGQHSLKPIRPVVSWESEHHGYVVGARWVAAPRRIVAGCIDGVVVQIDPFSLETDPNETEVDELNESVHVLFRHPHPVDRIDARCVEGSECSLRCVSASTIGQIVLVEVDVSSGEAVACGQWAHAGRVTAVALGPSFIVSAGFDGSCCVWDMRLKLATTQLQNNTDASQTSDEVIGSIAINNDGSLVATGMLDEGVRVYDMRKCSQPLFTDSQFQGEVRGLQFSTSYPNLLGVGCDDGTVSIIDVKANSVVYKQKTHNDKVRAIAWNNEKDSEPELVSAGWCGSIHTHRI